MPDTNNPVRDALSKHWADFRRLWLFDVTACGLIALLLREGDGPILIRFCLAVGVLVVAEFRGRFWAELHPDRRWWQS